ncbi:prepilin-type N-terminal cleavage/methylation domain-containing protein [bacterium]|nr:prepilin-type N-terminal cleavage/methylation domain-containing protein [bacterium]
MISNRLTNQAHATKRSGGFTLIEIMIVVAITGIILAIAAPTWMQQRLVSQQRVCQENLSKIDGAKEQWAMETKAPDGAVPAWGDLVNADGTSYLKKAPVCPSGGEYQINAMSTDASCTIVDPLDHNKKE